MRRQAAPTQETHSCLINSILIYKNIFQFFFQLLCFRVRQSHLKAYLATSYRILFSFTCLSNCDRVDMYNFFEGYQIFCGLAFVLFAFLMHYFFLLVKFLNLFEHFAHCQPTTVFDKVELVAFAHLFSKLKLLGHNLNLFSEFLELYFAIALFGLGLCYEKHTSVLRL